MAKIDLRTVVLHAVYVLFIRLQGVTRVKNAAGMWDYTVATPGLPMHYQALNAAILAEPDCCGWPVDPTAATARDATLYSYVKENAEKGSANALFAFHRKGMFSCARFGAPSAEAIVAATPARSGGAGNGKSAAEEWKPMDDDAFFASVAPRGKVGAGTEPTGNR